VGLLGTYSTDFRVRYRGELHDPNELALAVCAILPLLFAMAARRRRAGWTVLAVLGTLLVMLLVVKSQSRGGQLVFLAVLGIYFVRRFGWAGVTAALILAVPLLLLGGRSGSSAEESSMLRYHAWDAGLAMVRHSPLLGVGMRQFGEHYFLTAHNSYILTPAELGLPGMLLFTILLYLSVKTAYRGLRDFADVPDAGAARTWGLALLACWAGFLIQLSFLSFAYHSVLWVYFGVTGAYYSCVKSHAPNWRVRFGLKDLALCLALDLGFLLVLLPAIVRLQGV
jgi:O-antigen ligase